MAVRSKDEILASIRTRIGNDTSDEAIALVEDINDTFDDLSVRVTEAGDWKDKYEKNDAEWKEKYEKNDADWRTKYTDRFFTPSDEDPMDKIGKELEKEQPDETKRMSYDDLFVTE